MRKGERMKKPKFKPMDLKMWATPHPLDASIPELWPTEYDAQEFVGESGTPIVCVRVRVDLWTTKKGKRK